MRRIRYPLMAALAMLAACGDDSSSNAPAAAVAAAPTLDSQIVSRQAVARELWLDGRVEAVQHATVSAQTPSRVVELPVDVGDPIEPGQVIVRLRDVGARAQSHSAEAAVVEARARYAEAELAYRRALDVYERKLIARSQFDRADTEYKAAEARLEAAKAAAREAGEGLAYTVVRAPYAGIVLQRHVEVGEAVMPGSALLTGVSLDQLRVAVDVPEAFIAAVRRAQRARIVLSDGASLEATRLRIPPGADAQTHSFHVLAELPAAVAGLFPGTLVKTAFVVGSHEQLVIPPSALMRRGEFSGVYVIDPQGRLRLRYLRVGAETPEGALTVLSGLVDGERIAVDAVVAARHYQDQQAAGATL